MGRHGFQKYSYLRVKMMNKTHKTKIGNISHWTIQLAFRNQLIVAGGAVSFQFLYKLPSQPFRKALQIFVFKTSFICTSLYTLTTIFNFQWLRTITKAQHLISLTKFHNKCAKSHLTQNRCFDLKSVSAIERESWSKLRSRPAARWREQKLIKFEIWSLASKKKRTLFPI